MGKTAEPYQLGRRSLCMHLKILSVGVAAFLLGCSPAADEGQANQSVSNSAEPVEPAEVPDSNALQPVDNRAQPLSSAEPSDPSGGEDGMRWTYAGSSAGARLTFGVPDTDNVRLAMRCDEAGIVALNFTRPMDMVERRPGNLTILSGTGRRTANIEVEETQLGASVAAEAPARSAPFRKFRSGDDLVVRWGEERISVPGRPTEPIDRFFAACESDQ